MPDSEQSTVVRKTERHVTITLWRVQRGQMTVTCYERYSPTVRGKYVYCTHDKSFTCDHAKAVQRAENLPQFAAVPLCKHCGIDCEMNKHHDWVCNNITCFSYGS